MMGTWMVRANQLSALMSANVVTSDSSANGSLTVGNSAIQGGLGVTTLAANTILGGTLATPGTLYIGSNTVYGNGIFQFIEFSANSMGGFAFLNGTINFSNTTLCVGNINFANTVAVNNSLSVNNTFLVGNTKLLTTGSNLAFSNVNSLIANNFLIDSVLTIGNTATNNSINATSYSGVANNSLNLGGHAPTYFANVTTPLISTSVTVGDGSVNNTINATSYSGTANNALYLGGIVASSYQLNSTLAANVLTMASNTANNSSYFGGQLPAWYANVSAPSFSTSITVGATILTTNTAASGNVNAVNINVSNAVVISGNLNVTGSIVSSSNTVGTGNYLPSVNNSYLIGNSGMWWANGYFTSLITNEVYVGAGTLTATSYSGTANNTLNVGTVSAANVVSNNQLSSNLGNYQTTAGMSTAVAALTSNNTSFVGTVSAANVVSNNQLSSNLGNYTTTAGLAAVTVNNSVNFAGQGQAYYANVTLYTGNVNTTVLNVSGNTVANGIISYLGGAKGQSVLIAANFGAILRNDDTNFSVLLTNTGTPTGTWNTFRPFIVTLATGAVAIDGTGVGTTFGGAVTVNGSISANTITGTSNTSNGVVGISNTGTGVLGQSISGSGISGSSNTSYGGSFVSNSGIAVYGLGNTGPGVIGVSTSNTGISGSSNTFYGVYGISNSSIGIVGISNSSVAGYFLSNTNYGVQAVSGGSPLWAGNNTTMFFGVDGNGNLNAAYNANVAGTLNVVGASILGGGFSTGNTGSTIGYISTGVGTANNTGLLGFWNAAGVRAGYIGNANGMIQLESENGYTGYNVTANLSVAGNINLTGSLTCNTFIQSMTMNMIPVTTNLTIANTHSDCILMVNSSSPVTITVANTIAANTRFMVTRLGTGTVTIGNNAGVTLGSRTGAYAVLNQYGSASILMASTSLAIIDGNI